MDQPRRRLAATAPRGENPNSYPPGNRDDSFSSRLSFFGSPHAQILVRIDRRTGDRGQAEKREGEIARIAIANGLDALG